MKFINEGTVLIENTCDAIEMDLKGNSKRINPHKEHWLVQKVQKHGFTLYNLDTQRTRIVSRGEINILVNHCNWEISDEVA